ncbi:MAG TPA: glycerate kinase [bacterium (Candidatus Stahlbacteria)]|nr:glycerate kinase [Candidatus Stahlbacteria bacterium]
MRILVAPNPFKESLSAKDFIKIFKEEIKKHEVIGIPLSDGGDGFLDALPGELLFLATTGPLDEEIEVPVKKDGQTYYIESARILGLNLVPQDRRDPGSTTSKGLGRLIKEIMKEEPGEIVVGFGGSATVDFGIGALSALGIRFLDGGKDVEPTAIGVRGIKRVVKEIVDEVRIICACDVENLPPDVLIYAPQKGADEDMMKTIQDGIENIEKIFGAESMQIKYGGASGGIPLLFHLLLGAKLTSGAEYVLNKVGFQDRAKNTDLIITGEGKLDRQTRFGKVPYLVAKIGSELGIKVVAIVGGVEDLDPDTEKIFSGIFPIAPGPIGLKDLMAEAESYLRFTARQVVKILTKEE